MATWRLGVGALVLTGLAAWRHGFAALIPERRDVGRIVGCSLLGLVANQVLALEGMARTSSTAAGLLMPLIPVFTYGLAVLVRQEPFERRRVAGIAVALAGAVGLTLVTGDGAEHASAPVLGNALIAGNCLAYSVYLVWSRDVLARYPTLVFIALVYLASLPFLPFVAAGEELAPGEPTERALTALLWILAFPTVAAYLLNTYALARVRASTTAVYIYMQPLIALGAGVVWLDERPGLETAVPAVALLVGIGMVVWRAGRRKAGAGAKDSS